MPPRRRRVLARAGVALLCLLGLAGGLAGGYALQHATRAADVEVDDSSGVLSATVPVAWDHAQSTSAWQPPNTTTTSPALSLGTSSNWIASSSSGEGVFVALLPGKEIPPVLPQHPECSAVADPVIKQLTAGSSVTVVSTGCERGAVATGVTVERVVQVDDDRLLWVQIRPPTPPRRSTCSTRSARTGI